MIDGVTNSGSLPALERLIQFAGGRQRLIAANIANLDTPGFRPADVSVADFREQLGEAIDARRAAGGRRDLAPADSAQVRFMRDGVLLHPEPIGRNILFHDGNDRDLERTMQDLVENFLVFRTAAELLRGRLELLNAAISERV